MAYMSHVLTVCTIFLVLRPFVLVPALEVRTPSLLATISQEGISFHPTKEPHSAWSLSFSAVIPWILRPEWECTVESGSRGTRTAGAVVEVVEATGAGGGNDDDDDDDDDDNANLEHSFVVATPPPGRDLYSIFVAVNTSGLSEPESAAAGLVFRHGSRVAFTYSTLKVIDATGRTLASRMTYRRTGPSSGVIELALLDGTGTYPIVFDPIAATPIWDRTGDDVIPLYQGELAWGESFGFSLATCDLNDDGNIDFVVGAPSSDTGGDNNRQGRVYLYAGVGGGLPVDRTTINAPVNKGEQWFGTSLACGRHTNDAFPDLVVGAMRWTDTTSWPNPTTGYGGSGARGRAYWFKNTAFHAGDAGDPFAFTSSHYFTPTSGNQGFTGMHVDLLPIPSDPSYPLEAIYVGEPVRNWYRGAGQFHVLDADSGATATYTALDVYEGNPDRTSRYTNYVHFGRSTCRGDFDGDGLPDYVVTARKGWTDYAASFSGLAYVYMASDFATTPKRIYGSQVGEGFGMSCATADVNGDGLDDLLIGSPFFSNTKTNQGRVSLFLGSASWPATFDATAADYTEEGGNAYDYMGYKVISGGDINQDSVPDFVVGAPFAGEDMRGKVYVLHGLGTSPGLGNVYDSFRWGYDAHDFFGWALAPLGDINGDGYDDVLVSGWGHLNGHNDQVGKVWVVPGQPLADFTINATAPAFLVPPTNLTYSIVVSNNGREDDTCKVVLDMTPFLLDFVGGSCPSCTSFACTPLAAGGHSCDLGNMPSGSTRTLTMTVNGDVNGDYAATLTAKSASGNTEDYNGATATVLTALDSIADAALVTLTAAPTSVEAGTQVSISFDLEVTEDSFSTALDVKVALSGLQPYFTFYSVAISQGPGCIGALTCRFGQMAINGTANATVVLGVASNAPAGVYTLAGKATTASTDGFPSNDERTVDVTVFTVARLSVALSVSPSDVFAGSGAAYVVALENGGSSSAEDVWVNATLPPELQSVAAVDLAGVTCNLTAGNVMRCYIATLPPSTLVLAMVGVVNADLLPGAELFAEVTAASTTADPDLLDNYDNVTKPVHLKADVDVFAFSPDSLPSLGDTITFEVQVSNNGPATAVNVTLDAAFPPPASWHITSILSTPAGAAAACTNTSAEATCTIASLPRGSVFIYQFIGWIDEDSEDTLTLTANASGAFGYADNLGNNKASASVSVVAGADSAVLSVEWAPSPVFAGTYITATAAWINFGPLDAAGAILTATIPDGVSLVSLSTEVGACVATAANISCALGTIAASQQGSVSATFFLSADATADVDTTVAVAAASRDFVLGNQNGTAVAPLLRSASVALDFRGVPSYVSQVDTLNLILAIQNVGPSSARNTTLNISMPAGCSFLTVDNPGVTCAAAALPTGGEEVTCDAGTLAPLSSVSLLVTVRTNNTGPVLSTFDIYGTVTSADPDPLLLDNARVVTTLVADEYVDLETSLSVARSDAMRLLAGSSVVVALSVLNLQRGVEPSPFVRLTVSPSEAVTLSTNLSDPRGGADIACIPAGAGAIDCPLDVIAAVGSTSKFVSIVGGQYNGPWNLTAAVNSTLFDVNTDNNVATLNGTVGWYCDVAVYAVVSPDPVYSSEILSVLAVVSVDGPSDAGAVVATHSFPPEIDLEAYDLNGNGTCTLSSPGVLSCALGALPAGSSRTLELSYRVVALSSSGALPSTVAAAGTTPDFDTANNVAEVNASVLQSTADVELQALPGNRAFFVDGALNVTFVALNRYGPRAGQRATVSGVLPPGLYLTALAASKAAAACNYTAVDPAAAEGGVAPANITWECTDPGELVRFGTLSVVLTLRSLPGVLVDTPARNFNLTAAASTLAASQDPDPANNFVAVTIQVVDPTSTGGILVDRPLSIADTGLPWWLFLAIMGAIISCLYGMWRGQCFHAKTTEELLQEAAASEMKAEMKWEEEHKDELKQMKKKASVRAPANVGLGSRSLSGTTRSSMGTPLIKPIDRPAD